MTTITNVSGRSLSLPTVGVVAGVGESVEVPDDIADGLLEQSDVWAAAKPPAKPAATKGKS
jgi:hypothetical protein